jgi:hypothetical protein
MVTFFQALHRMDKQLTQEIKDEFATAIHYQEDPKVLVANLVDQYENDVSEVILLVFCHLFLMHISLAINK